MSCRCRAIRRKRSRASSRASTLPTPADVAPFVVSVFVQQSNGLTKTLLDDASTYVMTPGERLGLTGVTLVAE